MSPVGSMFQNLYLRLSAIPISFLGIGLQRAWSNQIASSSTFNFIDINAIACGYLLGALSNLIIAIFAFKIGQLHKSSFFTWIYCVTSILGTALLILGHTYFDSAIIAQLGLSMAFFSAGISMLMWCEFFAKLSPIKVALYYSCAICFGEVIKFALTGMDFYHLWIFLFLLPIFNIIFAKSSISKIEYIDVPAKSASKAVTFPWKAIALLAVLSFISGFIRFTHDSDQVIAIFGILIVPAIVAIAIVAQNNGRWFETLHKYTMPLIIVAMLLVLPMQGAFPIIGSLLFSAGHTSIYIMAMIVFSGLSARFDLHPLRLNGIERSIRYTVFAIAVAIGGAITPIIPQEQLQYIAVALIVLIIIVFSIFMFPNSSKLSEWGIHLKEQSFKHVDVDLSHDLDPLNSAPVTTIACENKSKSHKLTARESEVLYLLTQNKTNPQIESELFIAKGTLKAHISRIYTKIGVHTRSELLDSIEIEKNLILQRHSN